MRWCLGLMLLCFVGCQRPCNASSCNGCCTELGECVEGLARLDCGTGGAACVSCKLSERCVAFACEPLPLVDAGVVDAGPPMCTCATSCCLPDGSCAPNNGIDACGPVKTFCGTCAADQRCDNGSCVANGCTGCFTPLGACRPGTELMACGSDGGVCVGCGADQACLRGACRFTRCDQNNCRFGCCRADLSCETTISPLACGVAGNPCAACVSGQSCLGGTCQ